MRHSARKLADRLQLALAELFLRYGELLLSADPIVDIDAMLDRTDNVPLGIA
ncbi:hypothetical protein AB5I41_28865 [Sphingomonas sp. MMS24-JH45]